MLYDVDGGQCKREEQDSNQNEGEGAVEGEEAEDRMTLFWGSKIEAKPGVGWVFMRF
ncbi:MAG: hypothetical protein NVSMB46_06100 [Candidatus Saccharimonadales bacterium]